MKLLIWGTGRITGKVVGKHISIDNVEAFIDNNKAKKEYMGKRVISPEDIITVTYDAIVVANLYSQEIHAQCQDLGIDLNRVIFLYRNYTTKDLNTNYEFVRDILGEGYANIIRNRYHIVRNIESKKPLCLSDWTPIQGTYLETDHVRMKCFELAVKEIRKKAVGGCVAEVGVFRGEFAQFINYAFPDKKLYLFDTFDGFNVNEALKEVKDGNCTGAFVEAYKQTNIGMVLKRMCNLNSIEIKQGFFPDSLDDLEDRFAFVSLDLDFEDSIYAGLEYFYPRLEIGGYIFIHDYTSDLSGVEKAVDRYEKENHISLCKVPLCDANGTLVITK